MDLGISPKLSPILDAVKDFCEREIAPLDHEYLREVSVGDRWQLSPRQTEIIEGLKAKAKSKGLWNFFLTNVEDLTFLFSLFSKVLVIISLNRL